MLNVIYVLKLENSKYYVGRTSNLENRLEQHRSKNESAWTSNYPIIELVESFPSFGFEEDATVIRYMDRYGIENVRGGSFSNLELSFEQYIFIVRTIRNEKDVCLACGLTGHFISECFVHICYRCGRTGHLVESCVDNSHSMNGLLNGCYRCGRPDHWAIRCNRSKDFLGRPLDPKCIIM